MPSSRFAHHVVIDSDPEAVWEALQDAETWAMLGPVEEVSNATHDDGVLTSYRWAAKAGPRHIKGTAKTVEAVQPELMKLALDAGEVHGDLTAAVAEEDDGTGLTVTLFIKANGMLSTIFWDVISGTIGGAMPDQIEAFAARMSE